VLSRVHRNLNIQFELYFLVRVSPFVYATDKDGGIMARLNDSNVAAATFEYAEVLRVIALDI